MGNNIILYTFGLDQKYAGYFLNKKSNILFNIFIDKD